MKVVVDAWVLLNRKDAGNGALNRVGVFREC
jgi:hypothetical protein